MGLGPVRCWTGCVGGWAGRCRLRRLAGLVQGGPGAGEVETQREPMQAEARPVQAKSTQVGEVLDPELLLDAKDAEEPAMQGASTSGDARHGGDADPGTGWRPK